jgi:hypothetical protein
MAGLRFKGSVGVLIAGSMLVSSTGAVAATASAPLPQVNPWATLAVLSGGAPVAALCGAAATTTAAAAAAVQAPNGCVLPVTDAAPPVPTTEAIPVPPAETGGGFGFSPLLAGLLVLAGGIALYFALRHHHHAVSPA